MADRQVLKCKVVTPSIPDHLLRLCFFPLLRSTTSPTTTLDTSGMRRYRTLSFISKSPDVLLTLILTRVCMLPCMAAADMNVCDSSRGLEDVKVSCASIHSDHSSGLSKTLQEYRHARFTFPYKLCSVTVGRIASPRPHSRHVRLFSSFFLPERCSSGRTRSL